MNDDEPDVYEWRDDDGTLLAYLTEDEDGDIVGLDPDSGDIVGYWDPQTGEPLEYDGDGDDDAGGYDDADGYADDDDDPYGIADRIDELEQRLDEPREEVEYVQEVGPDEEIVSGDVELQVDQLERMLGRPLLLDEKRRIAEETYAEAIASGDRPDVIEASAKLGDMGEPLLDLDTGHEAKDHEARREFMTRRLADQERYEAAEAGADDLYEKEPPATQDYYDLDDRSERQAYLHDAMRGTADPSDTYSSSDYEE